MVDCECCANNAGISGHPEGSTPGQPTGLAGDL